MLKYILLIILFVIVILIYSKEEYNNYKKAKKENYAYEPNWWTYAIIAFDILYCIIYTIDFLKK